MEKKPQKEKGILPWVPKGVQRWVLILGVPFWIICVVGAIFGYISEVKGTSYLIGAVLYGAMAILAIYAGNKTKWLRNIEEAPSSAKVAGGVVIIGTGIYFLITAVLFSFILLIAILAIIVLGFVLALAFGGGGGSTAMETIKRTEKIQKEFIGESEILIGKHGVQVGEVSKAWFSDDRIIKVDGVEVGKITRSPFDKDVQYIQDTNGTNVGEIKTNLFGERLITDSVGNEIGKISKEWGETVIRKP